MEALTEEETRVAGQGSKTTARVAVVGATGYAGRELITLLARHPRVRITTLMSSGRGGGQPVAASDSHPALRGVTSVPVRRFDDKDLTPAHADVVFLATPHEVSHGLAPGLAGRGLRVIDLSGAFRLKDCAAYPRWYSFEHREPASLAEAVYGLTELNREAIRGARLVANPGCFSTSVILALAPLLKAAVIDLKAGIICDSKSGASGAGRTLKDDLLFSNVNENCRAYGLFKHRHLPEILQTLELAEESLVFIPHLLPITRGILSTIYVRLTSTLTSKDVEAVFRGFYASSPLVRVYEEGKLPEIQAIANTQYADLGFAVSASGRCLVVISALDNLGKGAAGQAVQNMNLMLGYREDTALR